MIVNFSITNFGSIKDKQTLSFEAESSDHLEDSYVVNVSGIRLLKMALIYGANASGKSTVLKALEFIRDLVLNPVEKKTDTLDYEPFLFDPDTPHMNSVISLEFIHDEVKYFYEVEFNKMAIMNESLHFFHPNRALVFVRNTDLKQQFSQISFGSKIKLAKNIEKTLSANTLWNNTVLGGFLKTNVDIKELSDVIDWFNNILKPPVFTRTQLESYVSSKVHDGHLLKNEIVKILKQADFHISDILINEEEMDIPDGFIDLMVNRFRVPIAEARQIEEIGKVKTIKIELEHTVNNHKYSLPLEMESDGTKRFFGFAGLLALLINESHVIPIDELETSLHPDLYQHFLLSFLSNSNNSQLIATTHNREILDDKDIIRNDAIWFTNKDENCSTEIYSLSDFDSSVVRNTTNILNAYKAGKLKAAPKIRDHYIN